MTLSVAVDAKHPAGHGGTWARLFGYDIFISFALGPTPRGSRSYASDLARKLRESGFTVFFSEDEAAVGGGLDDTLRRALHRSRVLVVIANRATLAEPRWVRTEVEEFRLKHPSRAVVPISIDGALQDSAVGPVADAWLGFSSRIWIDETREAGDTGTASDEVVERLVTAPRAVRSAMRLRAVVIGIIIFFAGLAGFAWVQREVAVKNEERAKEAQKNEKEQRKNAEEQRDLAVRAEDKAKSEATRADKEAVAARDAAEAERKQRQLAEERARIALSRQLLAQASLERNREGDGAERGALLALESLRLHPTAEASARVQEALRLLKRPVASFRPSITSGAVFESLGFTKDGGRIIASDGPGSYAVFDLASQTAQTHSSSDPSGGVLHHSVLSHDGQRLASWDQRRGLRVTDVQSGHRIIDYRDPNLEHYGKQGRLAFSRDGKRLLLVHYRDLPRGRNGYTMQFWDVASAQLERSIEGEGYVDLVTFTGDGARLLAAIRDGGERRIRIWALAHAAEAETRDMSHLNISNVCAIRADGKRVVLLIEGQGRNKEEFALFDVEQGRVTARIHTSDIPQHCLYSPDGKLLAVSGSRRIGIYDADNGYLRGELATISDKEWRFSPDGRRLAIPGTRVFDLETMTEVARILHPTEGAKPITHAKQVAFSPDGGRLASLGKDGVARVVDLGSGAELSRIPIWHPANKNPFGVNGSSLVVASSSDYSVRLTDVRSGKSIGNFKHKDHGESLVAAAIGRGNQWLVTAASAHMMHFSGRRPTARLWKILEGREYAPRLEFDMVVGALTLSPDASHAAASMQDGKSIVVWRLGADTSASRIAIEDAPGSIAIAPGGKWLAAGGKSLRVWELSENVQLRFHLQSAGAGPLAWSFDGRWLAVGFADRTLRVHEIGKVLTERGRYYHEGPVSDVAFSMDGRFMASSTEGGNVHVWDLRLNREIARLPHGAPVVSVVFDADARQLASLSKGPQPNLFNAHLWRWRADDLEAAICERVGRDLTAGEWGEYVGNDVPHRAICQPYPLGKARQRAVGS